MSIVPEHLPSIASPMPNHKETVSLQIEKANLISDVESLRNEVNFLDSFRNRASKLILKGDKDRLIKLEAKVKDYQDKLQLREKIISEIKVLIATKSGTEEDIEKLNIRLLELQKELSALEEKMLEQKEIVERDILRAQEQLKIVRQEIVDAQIIRQQTLDEAQEERVKIAQAWEDVRSQERNIIDRENALMIKQRDIAVYERRVEKKFKEVFPEQEMKFTS